MMADTVLGNLFREQEVLLGAQERVASQKQINRPSDDPVGSGLVLQYRRMQAVIEQYGNNVQMGQNRVELIETTLEAVSDQVTLARKLAEEQVGNSSDAELRLTAAEQVDQIRTQVLQLANTRLDDRFLFSGRATDTAPFALDTLADTVSYVGDNSAQADFRLTIGQGVEVSIPANGQEIFAGAEDIFDALKVLKDELNLANPDSAVIATQAQRLERAVQHLQTVRTKEGTLTGRLKLQQQQLEKLGNTFEEMRASVEDADMAQVIVELQMQQTVYQTTIQTAAKLIQPTLIDFLK
jgi:flagellar hook-associated protein 3 FlgL